MTDLMPNGANSVPGCSVEECRGAHKAKSFCAKHYARYRRTGHPAGVGKRGPKRPADLALYSRMFSEWSPRTVARFVYAHRLLKEIGDDDVTRNARLGATRPNGSFNVAEFVRRAESATIARLVLDESLDVGSVE